MTQQFNTQSPGIILRIEGMALLLAALVAYQQLGFTWWVFVLLLLWPDIAFLFYLLDKNIGVFVYNLLHTFIGPIILITAAYFLSWPVGIQFSLIWFAHIGMDRLVGYGLKYSGEGKDTHLTRV